jgi:hypothetical protein
MRSVRERSKRKAAAEVIAAGGRPPSQSELGGVAQPIKPGSGPNYRNEPVNKFSLHIALADFFVVLIAEI